MSKLLKIACTAVIIDCAVNIIFRLKSLKIDSENKRLYGESVKAYKQALGKYNEAGK